MDRTERFKSKQRRANKRLPRPLPWARAAYWRRMKHRRRALDREAKAAVDREAKAALDQEPAAGPGEV